MGKQEKSSIRAVKKAQDVIISIFLISFYLKMEIELKVKLRKKRRYNFAFEIIARKPN